MDTVEADADLTVAIEAAADVPEVAAAARRVAQALGFEHFIFGFRTPISLTHPCQFILSGYPRAWREHYDRNSYLAIDPVITRALGTILPFDWDELDKSDPAVARMFSEAAEHGLRYGFSVPVHGGHGEGGVLSLARPEPPLPQVLGARQRLFQQAQWFAALLQTKLRGVVFEEAAPASPRPLTRRERDCLRLAAEGHSAQAIAVMLRIAERTVVFHLNHAEQKLGARRRQQAVARGVALGQIEPACYPARFSESVRLVQLN
ncbi:MAG: LuxR family transcriptional regulator [Nevskiaceae bacterium]